MPAAIINFAAHRRQDLVLNNVAEEGPFVRDAYVRAHRPQSVLCMPLMKGAHPGHPVPRNTLATGAFTPRRLEMLRLLSAQIAISIENAQLYAELEDRVRAHAGTIGQERRALGRTARPTRDAAAACAA